MTTVVWSRGELAADTRVIQQETGVVLSETQTKIITPECLYCEGQRVLAAGFCGDALCAFDIIQRDVDGIATELTSGDWFHWDESWKSVTQILAVTLKGVYVIAFGNDGVVARRFKHVDTIAIGTGQASLVKSKYLGRISAGLAVMFAMLHDAATGGEVVIWSLRSHKAFSFKPNLPRIVEAVKKQARFSWLIKFLSDVSVTFHVTKQSKQIEA